MPKKITMLSMLVVLGLICVTSTYGATYKLGSSNNSLYFNSNGYIDKWTINNADYLTKRQIPFSIKNAKSGQQETVKGVFSSKAKDKVIFRGTVPNLKLKLKAVFTSNPKQNTINCNVEIEKTAPEDQAVDLIFELTLKKGPWHFCSTWFCAPNGAIRTVPGHNYSQIDPVGKVPASQAPWLIADDTKNGIMISHSMMKPRFFNYTFKDNKTGDVGLYFYVPLGLSSATKKFPNKANLEFALTTFKGRTYTRGGVQAYYDLYPEIFRSRIKYPGAWALWIPEKSLSIAKNCGMGFNQREYDIDLFRNFKKDPKAKAIVDLIKSTQKDKIKVLAYSEPWGVYIPFPQNWLQKNRVAHTGLKDTAPVSDVALKKYVDIFKGDQAPSDRFPGSLTRNNIYQIIKNCVVSVDKSNHWRVNAYGKRGFHWGTRKGWDTGLIILNSDPDLNKPNRMDITWNKARYGYIADKAKELKFDIDGLYLDSELYYAGWNEGNFRRDHWAVADVPLTYIKRKNGDVSVIQHMTLAHNDFLELNRKMADKRGYFVAGNTWQPLTMHIVPYVDMIGAGEHHNKNSLPAMSEFRVFRYLSYRKTVSTMDYVLNFRGGVPENREGVEKYIEPRLNKCLMYGIFPGTANAWEFPKKVKLLEPTFKPYVKIFKAINEAGWEPVNKIRISGKDTGKVLREQWGKDLSKGVYFTLHNRNKFPVKISAVLKKKDFGEIKSIDSLLNSKKIDFKNINGEYRFKVDIPEGRTIAIRCQ